MGIADTRWIELPAPVSKFRIRLGIVHIVSIDYDTLFVVTGDVSASYQFKELVSIADLASVKPSS